MRIVKRKKQNANGKKAIKKATRQKRTKNRGAKRDNHQASPRELVMEFIRGLGFGYDEKVYMRALPPKGAKVTDANRSRKFSTSIKALSESPDTFNTLLELNLTRGVYLVPNAGGHKDDEITGYNACFAEFDDLPIEEQLEIFKNVPLPPSALFIAKRSVHCYFFIKDGCSREQWEGSQLGIIAHLGSDPSIKTPAHLMRVPGLDHLSADGDGQLQRKQVECVMLEPANRYTIEQIQAAFPPVHQARRIAARLSDGEPIRETNRNVMLASIAGTLRRRGLGEEEIFIALMGVDEHRCEKPLGEEEVRRIAHSIASYEPQKVFRLTDLGNAERLVERNGNNLLYCHDTDKWHVWDGKRYQEDATAAVVRMAKETVRSMYEEAAQEHDDAKRAALVNWAKQSESERHIKAMVSLAASELSIAVRSADLDSDPWLLNVANGTVDLRTGELREHRREDRITKLAPVEYDPKAEAPEWHSFLESIMGGNHELIDYLQRAAGYSITGSTREQVVFFCSGVGSNGKSTFLDTLMQAAGDYAMRTPTETLMTKPSGGIPNDVARLKGARFVTAVEGEDNQRLAESLIKQMTGGDKVTARFLNREFFEFKPEAKIWLATNHKPVIRGSDHAIWRRIRLILFPVAFINPDEDELPEGVSASSARKKDKKLPQKLAAELPGVLRWVVEGCLAWQRDGLKLPTDVRDATTEYREEMDTFGAFLKECCVFGQDKTVPKGDLYSAYKKWCEESNAYTLSKPRFGQRLKERGMSEKKSGSHQWMGITLKVKGFAFTAGGPPVEYEDEYCKVVN